MVRTAITIALQDNKDIVTVSSTTIDSSLVTAGASVAKAFDVKPGTTRVRVYNSAGTTKVITFRKGGFATGIGGDVTIAIPTVTTVDILLNRIEAQVQQLDGSLYIDFQTGFTGTLSVLGEIGHLQEVATAYVTTGIA